MLHEPTCGFAKGFVQANLVVLPSQYAHDFEEFCNLNPKPCPLIERFEQGSYEAKISAPGSDIRIDLISYRKFINGKFSETLTECVGWDACHRSLGLQNDCSEILLRLGVRSPDKQAVISFSRLVASLILSGPPGVSVLGGVPKVQTIVNYWPALIDKRGLDPSVMRYHGDENCPQERSTATVVGQCMLPALE